MPYGLPSMASLSTYLTDHVKTESEAEADAWLLVKTALAHGDHLEAALENRNLPSSLLSQIIGLTWCCISEKDALIHRSMLSSKTAFGLGALLDGLFNSTRNEVHVVTTNYDRVAEFACNSRDLLFHTGFAPGYIQRWKGTDRTVFTFGGKPSRVVKIWKVHGSLDWFRTQDEQIVGLPVFELPESASLSPLIVTPGLNKYEKTYEDPFRTIINGADAALKDASAFLCVGFGFRDRHIHPKIIERCREKNVPIVVLARTLTDEAKSFLANRAGNNYLGIERSGERSSRIISIERPEGFNIDTPDLWSIEGFNSLVL
jgi:hypothetical protein